MGAIQATLTDLQWQGEGALLWTDPDQVQWKLDLQDADLRSDVRQVIGESVHSVLWKKAAKFENGAGLEQGPDFTIVSRLRLRLSRHKMHEKMAILDLVVQGGIWSDERRHRLRLGADTPACRLCGMAVGDLKHLYWECPTVLEGLKDCEAVKNTQGLCRTAMQWADTTPCFWLRGIVPWAWTGADLLAEQPEADELHGGTCPADQVLCMPVGAFAGTDGSGGANSRDPRLRQVGWGLAVFTAQGWPILWKSGGVTGNQTVPRSELWALCRLAEATTGDLKVYIDASYVVNGYRHLNNTVQEDVLHADLWHRLQKANKAREGKIQVLKMRSHCSDDELRQGLVVQPEAYFANSVADVLADAAADRHQHSSQMVEQIGFADARATKVLRRLTAIAEYLVKNHKLPAREKAKDAKPRRARLAEQLSPWLGANGHQAKRQAGTVKCKNCMKNTGPHAALLWLQEPCRPPEAKVPAMDHTHLRKVHRGLHHCGKCGFWATCRSRRLEEPCHGSAAGHGATVLRAIAKDKKPLNMKRWPDGSEPQPAGTAQVESGWRGMAAPIHPAGARQQKPEDMVVTEAMGRINALRERLLLRQRGHGDPQHRGQG
jgi:ribonuclease HI